MLQAPPPAVSALFPPSGEIKTVVRCTVKIDGTLKDCKLVSEKPTGYGGGGAAIKTAERYFKLKPATRDGVPVEGTITIPITFKPPPPPGATVQQPADALPSPSR